MHCIATGQASADPTRELSGRSSRNRVQVLAELGEVGEFFSAQQLHERLASRPRPMSLTTVYRALHSLEAAGLVDVFRDEQGERLYRVRPDGRHRHYLVCRQCSRSVPVDADPVERWADRVGPDLGFLDVEHVVELTGVCLTCLVPNP